VVARRVGDERAHLAVAGAVGGPGLDGKRTFLRRREGEAERPEGETAVILAELGGLPELAAVERDFAGMNSRLRMLT